MYLIELINYKLKFSILDIYSNANSVSAIIILQQIPVYCIFIMLNLWQYVDIIDIV